MDCPSITQFCLNFLLERAPIRRKHCKQFSHCQAILRMQWDWFTTGANYTPAQWFTLVQGAQPMMPYTIEHFAVHNIENSNVGRPTPSLSPRALFRETTVINALKCKTLGQLQNSSFVVRRYILNMHMPLLDVDVANNNIIMMYSLQHSWPIFRPSSLSPGPPSFSMLHVESIKKLGGPGDEAAQVFFISDILIALTNNSDVRLQ